MQTRAKDVALGIGDWLVIAKQEAHRLRLSSEDAEDCALIFIEKHLLGSRYAQHGVDPAWVRRCARNHAIDFHRVQARRCQHEVNWQPSEEGFASNVPLDLSDHAPSPLVNLLHDECYGGLLDAIFELQSEPLVLFVRRYWATNLWKRWPPKRAKRPKHCERYFTAPPAASAACWDDAAGAKRIFAFTSPPPCVDESGKIARPVWEVRLVSPVGSYQNWAASAPASTRRNP